MMDRWRWQYWPLKTKLLLLTLSISTLGILLVCTSLVVVENENYQEQLESELHVIADILAEQSAAALLFEDDQQLSTIISSLRQIGTIEQVCVYNVAGRVVSALDESDDASCPALSVPPEVGFVGDYYRLLEPVMLDGDIVGQFYLMSRLEVLREHIRAFILVTFSIGIVIQMILAWVALRLQRLVSEPIFQLSDAAERIARDHDYSIRVPVYGKDELGRLGSAFNEMIGTVQQQNLKILQSRDELERTVADRTSELSLANRELEAFSFSVSHDLRQPLRAIEGFGQALEEDCGDQLNETGRDYLSRIRTATVRMGGLIDGLLVLSRVSRQAMEIKQLDLSAMLEEIVEELRETTDPLPTYVRIQPGIRVVGDGRMIRVAFQNLLENAWKYTSKNGERRIAVTACEASDSITVAIRDNGVGFDMKYVDKLFVAFNRLHTPSEFVGTGLGLATVDRVVRRHFGEIYADSSVDKGACFYVRFPSSIQK
ncbi:ATP-binding protein [Marinobacter sp. M216]|uniref:histidine kinase n=1 Tax=Marinobacter albus TaxID=3030833 RepID=A0ABT7H767_9GAMM|nr:MULTISPECIES: ATP-binding protein [unclassified Marinobacter]MBW7471519.1 HAMP domain-containing protein [Marinobacter sp. F4218]MDK9556202.1 ATP-binding protein [Marinobacter sp. M216]